ncbi:hypothetical protein [Helicobacter turcicus]|uniref:Tetratricopeptide repeat-like domain-containing protein n=1 Tax=Helicobacter turcicus TaxID=2867412 RepID=A0ABS7JND1_9HELI|nr:hypothetical protein [Helicobacter turcicus]MBX7490903.1 hypothetical protein [Helicobacter turcicus]MBX7545757.1 hypothetical protein [Helicobacter turcicus]
MSLKQNVKYIKEEMNNDEKMLESLLRLESWFRRYKTLLFALLGIATIAIAGYVGNNYYQENRQQTLANAYEKALKGDEAALTILKDSKSRLYDLYLFQNALKNQDSTTLKTLESSKDPLIAQFAKVQNASLNKDLNVLNSQSAGDFGYLQAALLEMQAGNAQKAREILEKIKNDSPLRDIANALTHFSLKGINNAK